ALSGVFNARKPHRTIRTSKGARKSAPILDFDASTLLAQVLQNTLKAAWHKGLAACTAQAPRVGQRVVFSGHGLRSNCSRVIITCRIVLEGMPRCLIFVAKSSRDSPKGNCGRAAGCDSAGDERFAIAVTTSSRR